MTPPHTAVIADGLSLKTRRGRVYHDVTFAAPERGVTAILGSTGTGKTALLLTFAGRMKATGGTGSVCGFDLRRETARVRRCTGLGLVAGVNDLDDALTVRQHVREALLFRGSRDDSPRTVLSRVGLAEHENTHVRDLDIEQRERLGIALGLVGGPRALVVDDIDHDLDIAQQERVMELLSAIAAAGVTVLAACINEHTAGLADTIVRLPAMHTPALVTSRSRDFELTLAEAEVADAIV